MSKPLISIILPIYNVSQYLADCLRSLQKQSYSDFEALLIDDGSTDNSGSICRSFAAEDSRFIYLHKENGGVSDARNYGLDNASGEYICFVDPDDTVTEDYLSYLYQLLSDGNTSMSACNHFICRGNRQTTNAVLSNGSYVLELKEIYEQALYHGIVDISLWGKLYSRSVFDAVRFPVGKIFEDTFAFAQIMEAGGTLSYGHEPHYFYQIRTSSITTSEFDSRKLQYIEAAEHMCATILSRFPDLSSGCVRRRVHARISTLRFMKDHSRCRKEDRQKIIDFIKGNGKCVLKDHKAPIADKIAVVSLYFGENFFHFAWQVFCRLTGRAI